MSGASLPVVSGARPAGTLSSNTSSSQAEDEMTDREQLRGSNLEKDPKEWKTGDEPMTGAQASYLKTLSDQAGEPFEEDLSKAEASRRIDRLQERTGRGQS
jgi:Protein of unknown function (DUF3072)